MKLINFTNLRVHKVVVSDHSVYKWRQKIKLPVIIQISFGFHRPDRIYPLVHWNHF